MGHILNALNQVLLNQEFNSEWSQSFYGALRVGFEPFKPGRVETYLQYDLDFRWDIVHVEFPDTNLYFRFVLEDDVRFGDLETTNKFFDAVVSTIRNRHQEPIPDNIILGEE